MGEVADRGPSLGGIPAPTVEPLRTSDGSGATDPPCCGTCGTRRVVLEELGRIFRRCPSEICEKRRRRRRDLQNQNYHEHAVGPRRDPPRRRMIAELQHHYLAEDGAGFGEAVAEARELLDASGWSRRGFQRASAWTGLPIVTLRRALVRPSQLELQFADPVTVFQATGLRSSA